MLFTKHYRKIIIWDIRLLRCISKYCLLIFVLVSPISIPSIFYAVCAHYQAFVFFPPPIFTILLCFGKWYLFLLPSRLLSFSILTWNCTNLSCYIALPRIHFEVYSLYCSCGVVFQFIIMSLDTLPYLFINGDFVLCLWIGCRHIIIQPQSNITDFLIF